MCYCDAERFLSHAETRRGPCQPHVQTKICGKLPQCVLTGHQRALTVVSN